MDTYTILSQGLTDAANLPARKGLLDMQMERRKEDRKRKFDLMDNLFSIGATGRFTPESLLPFAKSAAGGQMPDFSLLKKAPTPQEQKEAADQKKLDILAALANDPNMDWTKSDRVHALGGKYAAAGFPEKAMPFLNYESSADKRRNQEMLWNATTGSRTPQPREVSAERLKLAFDADALLPTLEQQIAGIADYDEKGKELRPQDEAVGKIYDELTAKRAARRQEIFTRLSGGGQQSGGGYLDTAAEFNPPSSQTQDQEDPWITDMITKVKSRSLTPDQGLAAALTRAQSGQMDQETFMQLRYLFSKIRSSNTIDFTPMGQ